MHPKRRYSVYILLFASSSTTGASSLPGCIIANHRRHKNPGIHTTVLVPALIQTTMFDKIGLPANRLWRFLAPPMAPGTVVEQIVQALDAQESRTIRLPFYTQMARFIGPAVGILPKWLDDVLQKVRSRLMNQITS